MKVQADNDNREIVQLSSLNRKYQNEIDSVKEKLETSHEQISECKRKLSKSETEMKLWKSKYENEATVRIDELEHDNSKIIMKIEEMERYGQDQQSKMSIAKKQKMKLVEELKDSKQQLDVELKKLDEKSKKLKDLLSINESLKGRQEEFFNTIENLKKENIGYSAELFKIKQEMKNVYNELNLAKSEASNYQMKISEQAQEMQAMDGKMIELDGMRKKIENEKEDLLVTVDDLEFALDKANTRCSNLENDFEKAR